MAVFFGAKPNGNILMQQKILLPVKIQAVHPAPHMTSDMYGWGGGDDGQNYWLKESANDRYLAATEYFCFSLARMSGIPVPDFRFVLHKQRILFGCVDEYSAFQRPGFLTSVATGESHVIDFNRIYSMTFALDLFLANKDRTMHNFLFYYDGNRNVKVKVIDFGLAWWGRGFPQNNSDIRLDVHDNTVELAKHITKFRPFDIVAAEYVLDTLNNIDINKFQKILRDIPDELITQQLREKTIVWWDKYRSKRINNVKLGIKNGVYLQIHSPEILA